MLKRISLACVLSIAGTVMVAAQTASETSTKTNIRMTGGKSVTVTGCVEADPDGGYVLTHVADKAGALQQYVLVSTSDYFPTHVGQRVQVEGRAADRTHGHVSVISDTNTDGVKSHVETDARTDASGIRYLGADHMKTIATSCP